MNAKIWLILLVASLLLTSCGGIKPLEIFTAPIERTPINIQEPAPLKPKMVKWFVITPENADAVFADLKKKKYNLVLFGLTDDGYENLSMNYAEIRKYLIEQKAIIKAYKTYYESKIQEEPEE